MPEIMSSNIKIEQLRKTLQGFNKVQFHNIACSKIVKVFVSFYQTLKAHSGWGPFHHKWSA